MPAAGIRGFLDASEFGTWLKHFQSSSKMDKQNVKHFLLAGQVRYQKYDKNCRILRPATISLASD